MRDIVRGDIIGDIMIHGKLLYDGRIQKSFYAADADELKNLADAYVQKQKDELKHVPGLYQQCYPNDSWELRVYP